MPVLYRVIQGGWEKMTGETPKAAQTKTDSASRTVSGDGTGENERPS